MPRRLRSPLPAPRVKDRILVVHDRRESLCGLTKAQGLFSEFFAVLGALRYAERHGAAGVRVWFASDLYRDDRLGPNWWAYFFADLMRLDGKSTPAPETNCNGWHRFGPHAWNESWTSQIIPRNSNLRPYPLDSADELREVARLTQRHIRMHAPITAKVDAFINAHVPPGVFLIGLHFRGTDKVLAYPYRSPSFAEYQGQVDRVLTEFRPADYRVFIATDQTEFAEWGRATYGDRLLLQEDAPRLARSDVAGRSQGTHKHRQIPSHLKGIAAVLECLLLARCDYLIKNRSSLSDIALAFNPRLPWTFILDDGQISHGAPLSPPP